MNSQIDLTSLLRDAGGLTPTAGSTGLVAPPRRLVTRYILPAALLLGFLGAGGYAMRQTLIPTVPVRIVMPALLAGTPEPQARAETPAGGAPLFQAPGWVEPYPYAMDLTASTPGIVSRLHVLEGQAVSSGTLVAELLDTDAHLEVKQAEAALNLRRAEYEAAQRNWEYPLALRETARMAQAEKERLQAERAKAQQAVALAVREQEVNRELASRGAEGKFLAEKAALQARGAEIAVTEIDAKIRSAQAALESAEEKLRLRIEERNQLAITKAQMESAEADLAQARYRLSQRKVVATTSATIMRLHVGEGATLSMDKPEGLRIASCYVPDQLQVRADVPLAEAARVEVGMPAEIRVEALPNRVFRGEVVRMVHEADAQKNTLPVKVRILDPEPALKPEMIARLQFLAPATTLPAEQPAQESGRREVVSGPQRLYIPKDLVREGETEATLWLLGGDSRAHVRQVKLGPSERNGLREVASGLELPDKIIASNHNRLTEGCRVRVTTTEDQK